MHRRAHRAAKFCCGSQLKDVFAAQFPPVRTGYRSIQQTREASRSLGVKSGSVDMRRSLSSEAMQSGIVPSSNDMAGGDVDGVGSERNPTNVGRVASALLAKHVRTLEVLHSLQMGNAKLRREIQVRHPPISDRTCQ